MAISQAMCNSFKVDVLAPLTTDVIKMALYTSAATLSAATAAYSATDEVVGTGYTAGGIVLTGGTATLDGTVGIADFNDPVWTSSTITARGALIYNSTNANKAIAVIDFGTDKISAAGDFTVQLPVAVAATAIIRFA